MTAGAEGPPVLSEDGGGNVFNYSSGDWNVSFDPNATTVSFHVEPRKLFFLIYIVINLYVPFFSRCLACLVLTLYFLPRPVVLLFSFLT
jgi:hypothetical protein